jgi:pimeloyl-ACP methyl ester carboxylesterase
LSPINGLDKLSESSATIAITAMNHTITINHNQRVLSLEACWVGVTDPEAPVMIFLHEELGSVAAWNDFPHMLCTLLKMRGFVYSRPGYGRSCPFEADQPWGPDYLHVQAQDILPKVMAAAAINPAHPLWLFGHSDGATIALLYAARHIQPLDGLIVLAPHILVEAITLRNIAVADQRYAQTPSDLQARLTSCHDRPNEVFARWRNVWLSPAFRSWSIERELNAISCPVLAVQGLGDEYGTLEQVRGIARRVPTTRLCELTDCGHVPQFERFEAVQLAVKKFVELYRTGYRRLSTLKEEISF